MKTRTMSAEAYIKAFSYEVLMKRAFNVDDNRLMIVHRANMQNLLETELRKKKQLEKVKEYINKALARLINQKGDKNDIGRLQILQEKAANACYSHELMYIIDEALAITKV